MGYKQIGRLVISTDDSGWIDIQKCCGVTGEPYSVSVRECDYASWKSGTLAQQAFPYLSREDREFIISGTSPKGWEVLFGGDE
jgi:hypothetical protein